MILCSKLQNGLCKIVTNSQIITKFNVTKSRLHCTLDVLANLLSLPKPCLILDLGGLEIFLRISYSNFDCEIQQGRELLGFGSWKKLHCMWSEKQKN